MIKDKNLKLYEALAHEVAMDAAERRELTDDQREISKRLVAKTHERIAEAERAQRAKAPRKVRAEYAAMERPSLLSKLRDLLASQPRAALAFRDLDKMSDDDLRVALEDVTSLIERMS
jgi:sialic acid synthase SpsE